MNEKTLLNGFVYIDEINPHIIVDLRYLTKFNFVGDIIDGYKSNRAILSKEAAIALNEAWKLFDDDGFNIVIYDAFRPLKAADHFVRWFENSDYNLHMKPLFFPHIDHERSYELGYVGRRCGHTRGSTLDLTIIRKEKILKRTISYETRILRDGRKIIFNNDDTVDMGSSFDLFDEVSWSETKLVDEVALKNRQYFISTMENAGFKNYDKEWWHFTLKNEPYPCAYFDFDVE